jgi:hypothetical protein
VAITRPKPRDEPVTQTTCPAKGLSECILYSLANYGGEHIAPPSQCKRRQSRNAGEFGSISSIASDTTSIFAGN